VQAYVQLQPLPENLYLSRAGESEFTTLAKPKKWLSEAVARAATLAGIIFSASQAGKRDSKIEFSVGEHSESEKIPNHAVERSRLGFPYF
jgi:hypothetical protein